MELELVKASKYHSTFVWEWRNDEVSRKMFKNQNYVTWKDHNEWFEKSLLNSKRIMYVGILNENPVGIVRFDMSNYKIDECFVSINISPSYRGRGIGKIMLKKSIICLMNSYKEISILKAEVKNKNLASHKLFINCEFKISFENDDLIIYHYNKIDNNLID